MINKMKDVQERYGKKGCEEKKVWDGQEREMKEREEIQKENGKMKYKDTT